MFQMPCEGSFEDVAGGSHHSTRLDETGKASLSPEDMDRTGRVGFSTVEIRDYPIIVGDNPAVSSGVPLTIDWIHDGVLTSSVEEHEKCRPASRSTVELRIPRLTRESLLRRLHFSRQDILAGAKAANITRGRRSRTNETRQLESLEELLERATRAAMNATFRRSAKQKEREYLDAFSVNIHELGRRSDTWTDRLSSSSLESLRTVAEF